MSTVFKNIKLCFYIKINCVTAGSALGMSVNDFSESKDLEVMTFRRNAMACCKQYVDERESNGDAGLAMSIYPPDIHSTAHLPPHIMRTIQKGNTADSIIRHNAVL